MSVMQFSSLSHNKSANYSRFYELMDLKLKPSIIIQHKQSLELGDHDTQSKRI